MGSLAASTEDWVAGLRFLERRELPLEKMVTHVIPLERLAESISALDGAYRLEGRDVVKIVIDPSRPPAPE